MQEKVLVKYLMWFEYFSASSHPFLLTTFIMMLERMVKYCAHVTNKQYDEDCMKWFATSITIIIIMNLNDHIE